MRKKMTKKIKWVSVYFIFLLFPLLSFKIAVKYIRPVIKAVENYDLDLMELFADD